MSVKRCPECRLVNWATESLCKRCGTDIKFITVFQTAKYETVGVGAESEQFPKQLHKQTPQLELDPIAIEPKKDSNTCSGETDFQVKNRQSAESNSQKYSYSAASDLPENGRTKQGMALASLIFGILGFPFVSAILGGIVSIILAMFFGTVGAIAGISLFVLMIPLGLIFGFVALYRANKKPNVYGGKGFAIAGIVCSGCGILVLPVIAAIAIPNVLAARKAANEGSAIANLRSLIVAEKTYMTEKGERCADFKTLEAEKMIDAELAKGEKNGYRFTIVNLPTVNGDCAVTATPTSSSNGVRAFYFSTEDDVLRARKYDGKPAEPGDEPIN